MVDSSTEGFALEATGETEKLEEFIEVMRSYGEIDVPPCSGGVCDVARSQKTALAACPFLHERTVTSKEEPVAQA